MPVLDEAAALLGTLAALQPLRRRGVQLVVADGDSRDDTLATARAGADCVVVAPRGRASQMNAGAAACEAPVLLFLHADTRLPPQADARVREALAGGAVWGRFDVRIEGRHPMLRVVGAIMNLRSRWTGVATGDQAMFMRREAWAAVGGFPEVPLMEDIRMSGRLTRLGPPACLRERVQTSGRRWERHGVWRTIGLRWRLRAAHALGAGPARMAADCGQRPPER